MHSNVLCPEVWPIVTKLRDNFSPFFFIKKTDMQCLHASSMSLEASDEAPQGAIDEAVVVVLDEEEELAEPEKEKSFTGRGRYFTFTLNLGLDEEEALRRIELFKEGVAKCFAEKKISFISVGHEVAPSTGQHHLQGYFEAREGLKWSFETTKKLALFAGQPADRSLWIAASRGSAVQNQKYTQKDADIGRYTLVLGQFRNYGQGRDPGLHRAIEAIDEGVPMRDIYRKELDASAKHYRFMKHYKLAWTEPRNWFMDIIYIHGPSGSGKSSLAQQFFPSSQDTYWLTTAKSGNNVWWDGYDNHSTVVIDDWKPGYFGQGHVLFMQRLTDRYPLMVPVHGGQVQFVAKRIVFTTNTSPDNMDDIAYSGYAWDMDNPLFRRVYDPINPWNLYQIGEYVSGANGLSHNMQSDDPVIIEARTAQRALRAAISTRMRDAVERALSEKLAE